MPDDQRAKTSHNFSSASCLFLLVVAVSAIAAPLRAQDIADKFPDPARVTADYPDDAQRYAAFESLDTVLTSVAPKPISRPAYNKLFAYEANYNNIESIHMQAGMQSQAYKDWVVRRDNAIGDFALAHAVLARYQLSGLRAAPRPAPESQPMVNTPAPSPNPGTGSSLFTAPRRRWVSEHTLFFLLLPVALVSWVLMYFVASFLLGRAGEKSLFGKPPQLETNDGLPPLPEGLRVVHLPGVKYYLKAYTGLVLNKGTSVTTSSFTSTTPGHATVIGNTVQVTPGQTTTTTTRHQTDTLRMRTPDLRESTWTFTGRSGDQVFPGQILTALARPMKDDFSEFVLAYNHATGDFIRIEEGLSSAHASRGILGWLAQPVATLVGTVGFSIVIGYLLTWPPPIISFDFDMSGVILLMAGGFCSLTAAFFMTALLRSRVCDRRSKKLIDQYGPQFRQYCQQIGPALQKRLLA